MKYIYIVITLLLVSCKTVEKTENLQVENDSVYESYDSLWRVVTGHTTIVRNDSSIITFYRPDGTISAVSNSWSNTRANKEVSDTTKQVSSNKVQVKTNTIKETKYVSKIEAYPMWKKMLFFVFGIIIGALTLMLLLYYYLRKNM